LREPAAKLFHCVVVMGAAMGSGCGSGHLVDADAGADAAGAGGSSGGAGASSGGAGGSSSGFGAADCDAGAIVFSNYGCMNMTVCPGTPDAAISPADCQHPEDLRCGVPSSPTGCVCIPGAPHTAADCPDPAQFICDDYAMPCGCQCVANAPTGPEQCCPALDASADAADAGDGSVADAAFVPAPSCQTPFTCHSYDPPTGCACRMIPPPIL
jgi:hypothetical protein